MRIENIICGKFDKRKNRFLGEGTFNQKKTEFHIPDSGRLKELLFAGNEIIIYKRKNPGKTSHSLLYAKNSLNERSLINTSLHSQLVENFLRENKTQNFRKEIKIGDSRFDFIVEDETIEVKGCNLIMNSTGYFPDAPTTRGQKHLKGLTELLENGKKASIRFLLANAVRNFSPNRTTDPEFNKLFRKFLEKGGGIKFLDIKSEIHENYAEIYLRENDNITVS